MFLCYYESGDVMKRNKEDIDRLKGQVIDKYPELKEESNFFVCEAIIKDLVSNELEYDIPILNDLEEDERDMVVGLANKYMGLCFYDGSVDNWLDSAENANSFEEIAVSRILDNYDFLLELAKAGGEEVLSFADSLKDYDAFCDYAFIDAIRNNFVHDSLLKNILVNMSEKDSTYNIFSEGQKASLLTYPEGTLYFYGEESVKIQSPLILSIEIYNRMNEGNNIDFGDIDENNYIATALEMKSLLNNGNNFDNVVMKMSQDYMDYINKVTGKGVDPINKIMGIESSTSDYRWSTDNNELLKMFDNPYNPDKTSNKEK